MGSPKGRESYGDRVPVLVGGVTPAQGGREGRPQGEGAQMIGCHNPKGCVMQSAETVLGVLRERGGKSQPAWTAFMARKRRKTLVVSDLRNRLRGMPVTWHFRNRLVPERDEVRRG